jgi:hypothetical protein
LTDYTSMTTDDLHQLLDQLNAEYSTLLYGDPGRETQVARLTAVSNELRQRGELWSRLDEGELLFRYRNFMALEDQTVADELRTEIEKRGLPLPGEAEFPTVQEAEAWLYGDDDEDWYDDEGGDDDDFDDWTGDFCEACGLPVEICDCIADNVDFEDDPDDIDPVTDAQIEDGEHRGDDDPPDLPF